MTTRTLVFQPMLPPGLWVFLALASLAAWAWYGRHRPRGVGRGRWTAILAMSGIGAASVLLVLLNPTWLESLGSPGGKPRLTVLVDTSTSMGAPDTPGAGTRLGSAREAARAIASGLAGRFDVRVVAFAGSSRTVAPEALAAVEPKGETTDLAAAIARGLDEVRPQGQAIVLLSDGIHNAGGQAARVLDAARLARGLDAPIFTRTFGGGESVRDLALELPSTQELAFLDQKTPLIARVRRRGLGVAGATVVLTSDGREVARRDVAFDGRGRVETRFDVRRPKRGLYRYEVRVEPVPGEAIRVNNAAVFLLQVIDEPVRVLLLEGKPYWDAKFLMRTIASDPSIDLDGVVRIADGRYLRRSLGRPPGKEGTGRVEDSKVLDRPEGLGDLDRYQVVVLGRDADEFLGEEEVGRLRKWVAQEGGALVCYRGAPVARPGEVLSRLMPVRWARARESRFRVQLTERGQELRWLAPGESAPDAGPLAGLPTLARNEQPQEPKPLAVVLATTAGSVDSESVPVVTYHPYGAGRVVVIEGAGMWRWAFLPPQHRGRDAVYGELWHSLMRWLASGSGLPPGQELALRVDRVVFRTGEPVTATLLLRRDVARREAPRVELSGGDLSRPREVVPVASGDEPGAYRVPFGALAPGGYEARVAGRDGAFARTAFDVRGPVDEQLDLDARPDLMGRIAQESGASVLATGSASEVAERFQAYQARGRTERVTRYPAWDSGWVLGGVLLAWGAAWALRRSAGLV